MKYESSFTCTIDNGEGHEFEVNAEFLAETSMEDGEIMIDEIIIHDIKIQNISIDDQEEEWCDDLMDLPLQFNFSEGVKIREAAERELVREIGRVKDLRLEFNGKDEA